MLIVGIKPLTKGKSKVCFEDGTDLALYKKEINTYGLQEGTDIPESLLLEIETDILIPRAKKRAMNLLEQRDYTEKQLREKLSECGYGASAVEAAIQFVKDHRYVDDKRYAYTFVRMHCEERSRARIRADLRSRGIRENLVDRALEDEYAEDETRLIAELIRKKGFDVGTTDQKEKARMYRFLASKGFSSQTIMSTLRNFDCETM